MMPGMDQPSDIPEKDVPLREDIRLLGRILGDTVRSQEGEAVFEIVEGIRQSSIRFRRDEDQVARRELEATLNGLSRDQTIQIIRAFSYFSHLANIVARRRCAGPDSSYGAGRGYRSQIREP